MINARPSLQQIAHRGLLLHGSQRRLIVVDAQLLKRVVEVNLAVEICVAVVGIFDENVRVGHRKSVDPKGELVSAARAIGIGFGD